MQLNLVGVGGGGGAAATGYARKEAKAKKRRERRKSYHDKRTKVAKRAPEAAARGERASEKPAKRSKPAPRPAPAPRALPPQEPDPVAPPQESSAKTTGRRPAAYDPSRRAAAPLPSMSSSSSAPASLTSATPAVGLDVVSEHIFGDAAPTSAWTGLGLKEKTINLLAGVPPSGLGHVRPTLVQQLTIPHLLHHNLGLASASDEPRRDTLIKSETGSGKTLAFLVPIIEHVARTARWDLSSGPAAIARRIRRTDGVIALIMGPTRELCLQIYETVQRLTLTRTPWVVSGMICGGEKRKAEKGASSPEK